MLAIIETGGKQYRVSVGDQIKTEKLPEEVGKKVIFPVLLIEDGDQIKLGRPHVEGANVTGEVVTQKKDKKVISYTYRKRKASERKVGHRQPITLVKITEIKS